MRWLLRLSRTPSLTVNVVYVVVAVSGMVARAQDSWNYNDTSKIIFCDDTYRANCASHLRGTDKSLYVQFYGTGGKDENLPSRFLFRVALQYDQLRTSFTFLWARRLPSPQNDCTNEDDFFFDFMSDTFQYPSCNNHRTLFDQKLWNSTNPVSGAAWKRIAAEPRWAGRNWIIRELTLNCTEAVYQVEFDGRSYHYFNAALFGSIGGRYFDCHHILIFPDTDHYQYEWMTQPQNEHPGKKLPWPTTLATTSSTTATTTKPNPKSTKEPTTGSETATSGAGASPYGGGQSRFDFLHRLCCFLAFAFFSH